MTDYRPCGIMPNLMFEEKDEDASEWSHTRLYFSKSSEGAVEEHSSRLEGPLGWRPRVTKGFWFERSFIDEECDASMIRLPSQDDDRANHGDTGGGGREIFSPHFASMVSDPPRWEKYVRELAIWNEQQAVRPTMFGANCEVWGDGFSKQNRGHNPMDPEKPLWRHGRVNSQGWDAFDYAHIHTTRAHVLAYLRHPLAVANTIDVLQWVTQSSHNATTWMTQVRAHLILLEAIPWHYLKVGALDEAFVENRMGGLTMETWFDGKLQQLRDQGEWGQRQIWERNTDKKLSGGIADTGDGELRYLLTFHFAIALSVTAKLHHWLSVDKNVVDRDLQDSWLSSLKDHAQWLHEVLVGMKALRSNGTMRRVVSMQTWETEDDALFVMGAAQQQRRPDQAELQVFNTTAGWRIGEKSRKDDTELAAFGMWYFYRGHGFVKNFDLEGQRDDRWTLPLTCADS